MDLKLITDLTESRQYRSKQAFKQTNARTVCDHAFMDMIAIWILYNEFDSAPAARLYAERTITYNRFNNFRQSSTDLYLNLHVITENRTDLLASEADATLLGKVQLDVGNIARYLRNASGNKLTQPMTRQTLQKLEHALHIDNSNFRSIRRLAQTWPTLATGQKRTVLTRMIYFYRAHARRSEMYKNIAELANNKNLFDPKAKDPSLLKTAGKYAAVGAGAAVAGFAAGHQIGKGLL